MKNFFDITLCDFHYDVIHLPKDQIYKLPIEFLPTTDPDHEYFGIDIRIGNLMNFESNSGTATNIENGGTDWSEKQIKKFKKSVCCIARKNASSTVHYNLIRETFEQNGTNATNGSVTTKGIGFSPLKYLETAIKDKNKALQFYRAGVKPRIGFNFMDKAIENLKVFSLDDNYLLLGEEIAEKYKKLFVFRGRSKSECNAPSPKPKIKDRRSGISKGKSVLSVENYAGTRVSDTSNSSNKTTQSNIILPDIKKYEVSKYEKSNKNILEKKSKSRKYEDLMKKTQTTQKSAASKSSGIESLASDPRLDFFSQDNERQQETEKDLYVKKLEEYYLKNEQNKLEKLSLTQQKEEKPRIEKSKPKTKTQSSKQNTPKKPNTTIYVKKVNTHKTGIKYGKYTIPYDHQLVEIHLEMDGENKKIGCSAIPIGSECLGMLGGKLVIRYPDGREESIDFLEK